MKKNFVFLFVLVLFFVAGCKNADKPIIEEKEPEINVPEAPEEQVEEEKEEIKKEESKKEVKREKESTSNLDIAIDLKNGIYDSCYESKTDFYVCNGQKQIKITSTNSSKIEAYVYKKINGTYKSTSDNKIVTGKKLNIDLSDGEYKIVAYPLNGSNSRGTKIEREYTIFSNQFQGGVYSKNNVEIRYGVKGTTNFFQPNNDFTYYFKIKGKSLNGMKVTNTIKSKTKGLNISKIDNKWNNKTITVNDDLEHLYTGTFNLSKNGVYTINIKIGTISLSFDIGIIPRNKTANGSNFYYGLSPYLLRAEKYSATYRVQDQTANKSVISLMETAAYMGINVIREDNGWATIQSKLDSELNLTQVNNSLKMAKKYNMKYLWTLGNKRSDIEYYKSENLPKYQNFIEQIAKKYANNTSIIWEIWNEPDNREFFGLGGTDSSNNPKYMTNYGTKDQYLDFLKTASNAIKKVNSKATVIAGGLAFYYNLSNTSYRAWNGEKIFPDYANLLRNGTIDSYALHNHKEWGNDTFFKVINDYKSYASSAGLTTKGVYITESGVGEGDNQAYGLADKVLWYRASGYKMFIQFSMLDYNINNWNKAIFGRHLEPRDAAITYATVINMIGQANFTESINYENSLFAHIYYNQSNNTSIIPVFSTSNNGKTLTIPTGSKVYDMYGNIIANAGNSIKASVEPVYVVYPGRLTKVSFTVK